MKLFQKRVIHARDNAGRDTGPWMVRWSLLECFGWSLKLHHILRSDEDRDLHDHPWSFLSLILRGGYWEHTYPPCRGGSAHRFAERPADGVARCVACLFPKASTVRQWYGPGALLWRPNPWPHRLELRPDCTTWTLVLTTPKRREWGFHTICGWIPHTRYDRAKAEGC